MKKLSHMQQRIVVSIEEYVEMNGDRPLRGGLQAFMDISDHQFRDAFRALVRDGVVIEGDDGRLHVEETP